MHPAVARVRTAHKRSLSTGPDGTPRVREAGPPSPTVRGRMRGVVVGAVAPARAASTPLDAWCGVDGGHREGRCIVARPAGAVSP